MRRWIAGVCAGMCMMHIPRAARADALVASSGGFARVTSEKALIVWDEANEVEHILQQFTLEGDAARVGLLIPTPEAPTASVIASPVFDQLRAMAEVEARGAAPVAGKAVVGAGGGSGTALPSVLLQDHEVATLRASDADGLGKWLAHHGFADRPALRAWAKGYMTRGWALTALEWPAAKRGQRASLVVPIARLSVRASAPFYPYSEPEEDRAAKNAYDARWCKPEEPECATEARSLEVWVVARKAMGGAIAGRTQGPRLERDVRVTSASLGAALGGAAKGFDVDAEPTWIATHLEDSSAFWASAILARPSGEDLALEPFDIPAPAPMKGVPGWAPPKPRSAWTPPRAAGDGPSPRRRGKRAAAALLALLVAGLVLFAVRSADGARKGAG